MSVASRDRRYTLAVTSSNDTLILDRPEWGVRGLMARLSIMETKLDETGHSEDSEYFIGEVSLTSIQERLTLHRLLTELWSYAWSHTFDPERPDDPVDMRDENSATLLWTLSQFFSDVLRLENERHQPQVLKDVVAMTPDALVHSLEGFSLLAHHPTIFFGEGESGKSLVAFYLMGLLARSGVNVLILDWEMTADVHKARMDSIFGANGIPPNIHHLECGAPLSELVPTVETYCRNYHIGYLVVDSVAPACGAEAEASETANRYFSALRDIGVGGSLSIAHRTKQNYDREGSEKPFGSSFWHNLARETYLVEQTFREEGLAKVMLSCRKANLRAHPPVVETRLEFAGDLIQIHLGTSAAESAGQRIRDEEQALVKLLRINKALTYPAWLELSGMDSALFGSRFQALTAKGAIVSEVLGNTKTWRPV